MVIRQYAKLHLTEDEASHYMNSLPLLNIFGTIIGYLAAEYFGWKPTLISADVILIFGSSKVYFSNNFTLLMVGRSPTCFNLNVGLMVPFVHISKITTIK